MMLMSKGDLLTIVFLYKIKGRVQINNKLLFYMNKSNIDGCGTKKNAHSNMCLDSMIFVR